MRNTVIKILFLKVLMPVSLLLFSRVDSSAQTGRYWNQNLNSEAALLSGIVVAGEGGIAAIYYNPATISQMTNNNFPLSANLFSTYFFRAENALCTELPADRIQFNIYPRIIMLTLKPKKKPEFTVEMAYFNRTNEYIQINTGYAITGDIIQSNPGNENYSGDYYLRYKLQDYYGGAGVGYKLSDALHIGITGLISYKEDQYYNLITADAFTGPDQENSTQYLDDARFYEKHNMFDVRLVSKLGVYLKKMHGRLEPTSTCLQLSFSGTVQWLNSMNIQIFTGTRKIRQEIFCSGQDVRGKLPLISRILCL